MQSTAIISIMLFTLALAAPPADSERRNSARQFSCPFTCINSSDCCICSICNSGLCVGCCGIDVPCFSRPSCCRGLLCISGTCQIDPTPPTPSPSPCANTGLSCSGDRDCCDLSSYRMVFCVNGICRQCGNLGGLPAAVGCDAVNLELFYRSVSSLALLDRAARFPDIGTFKNSVEYEACP